MGVLRLSLFGPFGATLDGRPISSFRTRATQALLIYLACYPGQTQSRDHLMALLWHGLPEQSARLNLRQTIYRLRRLIPESPAINGDGLVPFLLADREAVQINQAARIEVDVLIFETLLHQGGRALQPAIELYRGEFLADFFLHDSGSFEEWTLARREELCGRALKALDTLAEEALQSGEPAAAEAHARQALAIDNLRESAHRHLMTALAQSGRRRAAVTHFQTLSRLLNNELGIGPSAATQTVYEAVCSGKLDPTETASLVPTVNLATNRQLLERPNLPEIVGRGSAVPSPQLRISTFGSLRLELGYRVLTNFASSKAQALLVYLAANPRPHPRELLADLFWDERTQKQALSNLRVILSSLRKQVGASVIITRETAAINPEADVWLDAAALEKSLPDNWNPVEVAANIELYQGEFLAGFFIHEASGFEAWQIRERERLHRLALVGLQRLVAWELDQGHYAAGTTHVHRLLELDPLLENAHGQLMQLLAFSGQRTQALAQYESCRKILREELGVLPSAEIEAVAEAIRSGTVDRSVGTATHSILVPTGQQPPHIPPNLLVERSAYHGSQHNLPNQTTAFIGRAAELHALDAFAADPETRLITIVGPGGIGKTCLALEAARLQIGKFMHGVWYTSLAALSSPEEIVPAIAHSLNVQFFPGESPRKQLLHYLKNRTLFLLLDNYEHLLAEVALVSEILAHAPGARILVTSREPLRLVEEQLLRLDGLAYTSEQAVEDDPAVQLFLERARRLRPGLAIRSTDLPHLTTICHQVDGMPLGLVLAATWADTLSLEDIAGELQESLDLLETDMRNLLERHRSMQAVFDVSWGRLKPEERKLFAELTVFRGGFSRDAAWKTCTLDVGRRAIRDLLAALSRKSFLRCDPASGRYDIHELMRQYGAKKLSEDHEHELRVRDRHAAYFCEYLGELYEELKGPRQKQAAIEIDVDYDNGRSAWLWAIERRMWPDLQKIVLLWDYFLDTWRSRHQEADKLYATLMDGLSQSDEPLPIQLLIVASLCRARFQRYLGHYEESARLRCWAKERYLQPPVSEIEDWPGKAFALSEIALHTEEDSEWYKQYATYVRLSGNAWEKAFAFLWLGNVATFMLREEIGRAYYEEGLAIGRQLDNQILVADLMLCLSNLAHQQFRFEDAEALAISSLEIYAELENKRRIADALDKLGHIYLYSGRYAKAVKAYRERLQLFEELAVNSHIAWSHFWLSHAFLHAGEYQESKLEAEICLSKVAGAQYEHAICLTMLGNNALIEGDLATADRCFANSEADIQVSAAPVVRTWYAGYHVVTLVHCGELERARQVICKALDCETIAPTCIILFAGIALLHWAEKRWLRAVELYAMACTNPYAGQSRWVADVVGTHIRDAEASLAEDVVAAACRRGQSLSIKDAAAATLAELSANSYHASQSPTEDGTLAAA